MVRSRLLRPRQDQQSLRGQKRPGVGAGKSEQPLVGDFRLRKRFPRLDTPNVAFRNRGDLTFEESGARWGFHSRRISHGMALADLDNDGDLDVVINCLNDAPLLCRNDSPRPRIAVRLRGQPPNTRGVGAKVRVLAPGFPPQSQEIISSLLTTSRANPSCRANSASSDRA